MSNFDDVRSHAITLDTKGLSALREEVNALPLEVQRAMIEPWFDWNNQARKTQLEPNGKWRTWVVNGGRGSGKTRTGSETFQAWAENGEFKRGAMIGRTGSEVRDTMVEGEAGILAVAPPWAAPTYYPGKGRLVWHSLRDKLGFEPQAKLFSADKPAQLRGPHIARAWADEVATWRYPESWSNLQYMLRAPKNPRAIVTTTPAPTLLIKKLYARDSTVMTTSSTFENAANLADEALQEYLDEYAGTEEGRQELFGELLEEAEGALWQRAWIEENRLTERNEDGELMIPDLDMLVVAVDPAVTSHKSSDETGIVLVGRNMQPDPDDADRMKPHYYICDDASGRLKPAVWAKAAIAMRQEFDADYILGEVNNGGDLVEHTIATVDDAELFKAVHASRGKKPRATPVSSAAQQGRVHHVGQFDRLEDELCTWIPGSDSPSRLDAMVWGVIECTPKGRRPVKGIKLDPGRLAKSSHFRGPKSV